MYPRELGPSLQKWVNTQVAVGARVPSYHDEVKIALPAIWTPTHHLLFTFFHIDLQTKLEAPKPVSSVCFFVFQTTALFCHIFFTWFLYLYGLCCDASSVLSYLLHWNDHLVHVFSRWLLDMHHFHYLHMLSMYFPWNLIFLLVCPSS